MKWKHVEPKKSSSFCGTPDLRQAEIKSDNPSVALRLVATRLPFCSTPLGAVPSGTDD